MVEEHSLQNVIPRGKLNQIRTVLLIPDVEIPLASPELVHRRFYFVTTENGGLNALRSSTGAAGTAALTSPGLFSEHSPFSSS